MGMALGSSPTPPEIRSPERDRPEDAAGVEGEEEEEFGDAFDIPHKNASHDSLLRWRVRDPSSPHPFPSDCDLGGTLLVRKMPKISPFWRDSVLPGIGTC